MIATVFYPFGHFCQLTLTALVLGWCCLSWPAGLCSRKWMWWVFSTLIHGSMGRPPPASCIPNSFPTRVLFCKRQRRSLHHVTHLRFICGSKCEKSAVWKTGRICACSGDTVGFSLLAWERGRSIWIKSKQSPASCKIKWLFWEIRCCHQQF